MKGFLTIQEFSNISGIEVSTLRYWDEIGLFSPITRDPENNYRYYSLEQIVALNFITTLSDLGIPLKTIAELRKTRDAESLLKLLESKERELDMQLRRIRESSSIIHIRQEMIREGLGVKDYGIGIISIDENRRGIVWPKNEYKEDDTFLSPLTAMINDMVRQRINLGFPIGGRFDSIEAFVKTPHQPQYFFSIDPSGVNERKKGEYVVGYAHGNYGDLGDLPIRMDAYIKENNLKPKGFVFIMYLLDEICTMKPEDYLAQVMIPLVTAKKRGER